MKKVRKKFRNKAYTLLLYIGTHQEGDVTYQTQIATALKLPITTVNYHITNFKEEGLITKDLKLTSKGLSMFKSLWEGHISSMKNRVHNLQVRFYVSKCPDGFPGCFSKEIYQPIGNKRYKGLKTTLRRFTIIFYSPKKIVGVLPDIYADTAEDATSALILICNELKELIELEFQGVKIDSYKMATITTMHAAHQDSVIAITQLLTKSNYKSDRIEIDSSMGKPEIEAVKPETALQDLEVIEEIESILQKQRARPLLSKVQPLEELIEENDLENREESTTKCSTP